MRLIRTSIRLKLTVATMVPLFAAISLCWIIGSSLITTRIFAQAQNRVRTDLSSAHELLMSEQARIDDIIRLTSLSPELTEVAGRGSFAQVSPQLGVIMRNERLAFLTVVDRFGMVRYRTAHPAVIGDSLANMPAVGNSLRGVESGGVTVLDSEAAARENPALPALMTIRVKPTPHARTYAKSVEERGMFLVSASPLKLPTGEINGAVYGGVLINGDSRLVDRISRVLFDRGEGGRGNATIFLDDVRIATSVVDEQQQRVIGTRMSEEVYNSITRGESWSGRAFVYSDWHLSSYEPVRDLAGSIIGALYVGTPEQPLLEVRSRIHKVFSGVILFVTILGVSVSAWVSSRMARPIKALEEGARRIAAGERLADITVGTHDEIAALADEFNIMKQRLVAREGEVLALNRTLEQKVVERTAELEEKGRQLLATQSELARAERLAGIGTLAAGVAHEINNPLAIIRGNAELLQFAPGDHEGTEEEVAVIINQVGRVERIVRNLLTFSRSGDKHLAVLPVDSLLDGILDQMHHQIDLGKYRIERYYRDVGIAIEADGDQLRQVFTNLVLNGLQAMPDGGILAISASVDAEDARCRIVIADTGAGIDPEQMEKLFTPFYSTKRGGTGLGLAVSYGIVKDHGGEIVVRSEGGRGAEFTIILPLRQTSGQLLLSGG